MRCLIVYDTVYGSTAQIARWIAERLEGFPGAEVEVARVGEAPSPEGYEAVLVGGPIHRGDQVLESVREYVREYREELAQKAVGIFVVALDVAGAYFRGRVMGGVEYLRAFAELFAAPPIYGKVLGGNLVPPRLTSEDREGLRDFYRRVRATKDIPYRTALDQGAAWEFAARFFHYASR
ncbi:flavodoxin domain-containing protein [Candidatus Bipolaricaulota bacterium]|nr:flavodoxin domain-containing protein [Candidatus Bipolaricaulota bacterium]